MKQPPTKFQIMRGRRIAPSKVEQLIDGVESEVEREWSKARQIAEATRRAEFVDTADWLRDTKKQAQAAAQPKEPEPGFLRVLLHALALIPRAVSRRLRPHSDAAALHRP